MSQMMTPAQVQRFFGSLITHFNPTHISSDAAQTFINSPYEAARQIERLLGKGLRVPLAMERFPRWREVELSGNKTGHQLLEELKAQGLDNTSYYKPLFESQSFSMNSKSGKIDLALVCPEDLGFNGSRDYITTKAVFKRAYRSGLNLCPSNLGPEMVLRLKETLQDLTEMALIGMEPILVPDRKTREVFCLQVDRRTNKFTSIDFFGIGGECGPKLKFIFMRNELN